MRQIRYSSEKITTAIVLFPPRINASFSSGGAVVSAENASEDPSLRSGQAPALRSRAGTGATVKGGATCYRTKRTKRSCVTPTDVQHWRFEKAAVRSSGGEKMNRRNFTRSLAGAALGATA